MSATIKRRSVKPTPEATTAPDATSKRLSAAVATVRAQEQDVFVAWLVDGIVAETIIDDPLPCQFAEMTANVLSDLHHAAGRTAILLPRSVALQIARTMADRF